jgi:hypothetical protein
LSIGIVIAAAYEYELVSDGQLSIEKSVKYAFEGDVKILYAAPPKWSPNHARNVQ